MTATTVAPASLTGKQTQPSRAWRCQFCATGHHGSCPGAVRQTRRVGEDDKLVEVLWLCLCTDGDHPGLHCLECKNDNPEEVNEETWACLDRYVCAGLLEKRREHNRLWQMIQASRSHGAVIRRAKRLGVESMLAGISAGDDDKIEQLRDQLDKLLQSRQGPKKKAKAGPPRPRAGKCECCGDPTKGGRFLPGHDAKLASSLKERVQAGDVEAYEEMKSRNWLNKLPAKYREGVLV